MKVFDLRCGLDHRFEGWFGSEADYDTQRERGLLTCPMCGDAQVTRLPSAARLSIKSPGGERASHPEAEGASAGSSAVEPRRTGGSEPAPASRAPGGRPMVPAAALQAAWLQAVRHVLAHTEDVGERFVDQARDMHQGRIDHRPIRGQATPEQAEELRDEGIEVVAIPVPVALKGPVQ